MKLTSSQLVLSLPTILLLIRDCSIDVSAFTQVSQMNPFILQRAWRASTSILSKSKNLGKKNFHSSSQLQMCGLLAVIDDVWKIKDESKLSVSKIPLLDNISQDGSDNKLLSETTNILYHRGPDGMTVSSGTVGSSSNSHARWAMGHTRLAIVDPNNRNADMPFQLTFENKNIKLAANGEIYNHEQIYDDLVKNDDWSHERISGSDCEVIAHHFAKHGGPATAAKLDGMFAFVLFEENTDNGSVKIFAARDPVGIKPLYYGRTLNEDDEKSMGGYIFSSELKALVGHVDPSSVVAIPAGHYWTPEEGLVCYYNPDWLRKEDYSPWKEKEVKDDEIREAFTKAIKKRMMSDVDYGFFLSGGIDSAVVAHVLLPLWRELQEEQGGEYTPLKTFTVGMENSPDVMAAKGVVEGLGGEKYVDHTIRYFTPDEVFDMIPKIVYHMETYEAELIRSSIPNWFLAEAAAKEVKMVLTGEGADELFAGYLYFKDAGSPTQLQNELKRIYGMLGNINLHRTDRMTMAHGLEARVPFLDTEFTKLVMSVDPSKKIVDAEAVKTNSRGREKTMLRELFEGPNANGDTIPPAVLWRAKAMQCEGVGEDWVSILQRKIGELVSDEQMAEASSKFPLNPPQTKEEYYYRDIFESNFKDMAHVVKLWEGGGRAMGAEWKSDLYTREGLKNVDLLSHALQQKSTTTALSATATTAPRRNRCFGFGASNPSVRTNKSSLSARAFATDFMSISEAAADEACSRARSFGYSDFESMLTTGSDDRSLILETGSNKYHIMPQPIGQNHIFRGSCTGNPPTQRGYDAAKRLFENKIKEKDTETLQKNIEDIFEDQRSRLSKLLNLPDGAEIILCPSGSDAEYLVVAIARELHPDSEIVNGVTQLNEIGAGSAPASVGEYFASYAPLLGKISDQGCSAKLEGFENVGGITVTARSKNGNVIDSASQMKVLTYSALEKGQFPIIHGVFGGKTGIRDQFMPPSLEEGEKSLGVVDACQGRFTEDELHGWLEQDSIVLFTGSKFYQAPTFCAAVIIPPNITAKLKKSKSAPVQMLGPKGIGGFITDEELPKCLDHWKPYLKKKNAYNIGLALRWEAGLVGMSALSSVSDKEKSTMIEEWSKSVKEIVDQSPFLDAWCVERSIVSIRIAKNKENLEGGSTKSTSSWLDIEEARKLYRWMSKDVSDVVKDATNEERDALSKIIYIGQPVNVSESHAIVRIALGVESLLSYNVDKERTVKEDEWTVRKLTALARHFDLLEKSGL